ncbi:conjugal transfer protein TraD [Mesorhizobium sp. CAU 1732]|uniref:conjugal transfer protein TraD n=1 Tax=Mesorhizobium sp. CAU 1732 TaxID=3140358 RepID=UPI0032602A6F
MTNDRKKDAREKITLGGLVVKAGLRQADRAFLLGVLLEAASIRTDSNEHHRLKAKGAMAFRSDRAARAGAPDQQPSSEPASGKIADG